MTDTILVVLAAVTVLIGGASGAAALIAPLTKNTKDDAVAKALKWVYGMLRKLGLNDKAPQLPEGE